MPHQEINASPDEPLECVLVRSDGEAVAINLDIEPVEKPEKVLWVDPVHRDPRKAPRTHVMIAFRHDTSVPCPAARFDARWLPACARSATLRPI